MLPGWLLYPLGCREMYSSLSCLILAVVWGWQSGDGGLWYAEEGGQQADETALMHARSETCLAKQHECIFVVRGPRVQTCTTKTVTSARRLVLLTNNEQPAAQRAPGAAVVPVAVGDGSGPL